MNLIDKYQLKPIIRRLKAISHNQIMYQQAKMFLINRTWINSENNREEYLLSLLLSAIHQNDVAMGNMHIICDLLIKTLNKWFWDYFLEIKVLFPNSNQDWNKLVNYMKRIAIE